MRKWLIALCFLCLPLTAFAGQNTLTWQDNSTNETNFNIERKAGICSASVPTFTPLISVGVNVTTYVDTAVVEGVTYCYRVNASNSAGVSPFSNTAERLVPFTVPSAPSGLVAN
jgi:hypothetical protein